MLPQALVLLFLFPGFEIQTNHITLWNGSTAFDKIKCNLASMICHITDIFGRSISQSQINILRKLFA